MHVRYCTVRERNELTRIKPDTNILGVQLAPMCRNRDGEVLVTNKDDRLGYSHHAQHAELKCYHVATA